MPSFTDCPLVAVYGTDHKLLPPLWWQMVMINVCFMVDIVGTLNIRKRNTDPSTFLRRPSVFMKQEATEAGKQTTIEKLLKVH